MIGKKRLLTGTIVLATVLSGGLFGFFFTMSYVIMPGFDQTPAYSALIANQMIGRATQGSYFFVLLLGTPIALIVAITLARKEGLYTSSMWLLISFAGWVAMMVVTFMFNVPLNQQLDALNLYPSMSNAEEAWRAYSIDWQFWNHARVLLSGSSIVSVALSWVYFSYSESFR